MFRCKHIIPQEFDGGKPTLQENYRGQGQRSLLYKFCAVSGETEAIKQQNGVLTAQIDELTIKLANSQDLQKKYKGLKAKEKQPVI